MNISEKQVNELRAIYQENTGYEISPEEAKKLGKDLIELIETICFTDDFETDVWS